MISSMFYQIPRIGLKQFMDRLEPYEGIHWRQGHSCVRAFEVSAWSLWSPGLCSKEEECDTIAPAKLPYCSHTDLKDLLSSGCSAVEEERLWGLG